MLDFFFEHHLVKKMSPSMRTTVGIALFSITVLLAPYLPFRRGSPPVLSGGALPPPSQPFGLQRTVDPQVSLDNDTASAEAAEWKSAVRNLGLKEIPEQSTKSPERLSPPPIPEGASVKREDEGNLDPNEDQNAEPPLETDTLDDLDSFLDAER